VAVGSNADDVWHFEPTWWNGMSRKQLDPFGTGGSEDLGAMRDFCAPKQGCCTARPGYAASFVTDWKGAEHVERMLRYRGIRQHPGKVTERAGAT
jgi:hypothetical protein